jgi:hypothetical protein
MPYNAAFLRIATQLDTKLASILVSGRAENGDM